LKGENSMTNGMSWELKDKIKKALKLAKECLTEAGHTSFQKDCPICNPEYAQELIKEQKKHILIQSHRTKH